MDWGQALFSGIAAGANGVAHEYMQDQDEQRWLEKEKQLQSMRADEDQRKARYMMALEPPKVQTINTTNDKGEQVTRQQQWVAPTDDDLKAGRAGHYDTVGEAPNINFERLEETNRHNKEVEGLNQSVSEARAANQIAQLGLAQERLNNAAERAKGAKEGGGYSFKDYQSASPDQRALYDRYRRGEEDPSNKSDVAARTATLKWAQENPDATPEDVGKELAKNQALMGANPLKDVGQAVSGLLSGGGRKTPAPMGQFAPKPAQSAPAKQVQRTGTKNGRKVIQYSDGTVVYADTGQPAQ